MKVLVCDDHAVFRDGLRHVVQDLDPALEWLEAEDGERAIEVARAHPDLTMVLLDLEMPGIGGLEGLRRFQAERPELPVVIVSASDSAAEMREAIDAGAAGFVPKSLGREEMQAALKLVGSGGVFVPREALAAPSKPDRGARRREGAAKLTARQTEVLALMARGLTNKEIHEVLGISENTVKTHVAAILELLDATNRTEASVIARELDLRALGEE